MAVIRNAEDGDARAIASLLRSVPGLWDPTWRPDVVERALAASDGVAFVAQEDSEVVGFACAHDVGFRAYLSELVVRPNAQAQGIGRALVEAVESSLAGRGCAVLISDVWHDAEGFYRVLGWSQPDVRLMRRRLEPGAP